MEKHSPIHSGFIRALWENRDVILSEAKNPPPNQAKVLTYCPMSPLHRLQTGMTPSF